MSYGADRRQLYRRAAELAKFELVINLKAANALPSTPPA
jgi:hypothetical protein